MITTEWKLGRTAEACSACRASFAEGDVYHSALFEDGEARFRRGDYCPACFPPAGESPFSHWRSRRMAPNRSRRLNLDQIRDLFLRAVGSPDAPDQELAYLLALLLLRKKRLKLRETRDEGERRVLWLESPTGDGPFPVVDPVLSAERLDALDRELRDILVLS